MTQMNDLVSVHDQHVVTSSPVMHNVDIVSGVIHVEVTTDGDAITGFVPPDASVEGWMITVLNISSGKTLALPVDTGSTAGHRLLYPTGIAVGYVLTQGQAARFYFVSGVGWFAELPPTVPV